MLLFTIPHLMVGSYDVPDFQSKSGVCSASTNSSSLPSCNESNGGMMWYYMMIFVTAQIIHGAGICPLYSLVPAYLDENVEPKQVPIYLGLWYLSAFLGPGTGILLGGQFLSVFVDIKQVNGIRIRMFDRSFTLTPPENFLETAQTSVLNSEKTSI